MEILWALVISFIVIFWAMMKTDKELMTQNATGGMGLMALNKATVIVVMQDIDYSQEIYYVKQIFNPESSLANYKYFAEFIFYSDVYESREKAVSRAKELERLERTDRGILVYDGFSSFTFGDAMAKFNAKSYVG